MLAYPYNVLYIDPDSGTGAKCNNCAHRIEVGREPTCVSVCSEHAIVAGDMHNPITEISQLNITHAVHPDPISEIHCWRQRVKIEKPKEGGKNENIFVDTNKSHEIYKEWMAMTRPAPGHNRERRTLWFVRAFRPDEPTFYIDKKEK